jgi:hypothetical protein
MANGGIIGPVNIPTSTTATGVWQQEEQYEAKVTDTWPQRTLFTTKSLRFNDGSSDYLSRNEGAGNRRTFTLSAWCKRSGISSSNTIFSSGTNGDNYFFIDFSNNNRIQCLDIGSGSYQIRLDSNRLIRDPSAWYHIVLAVDTTQGTASNRVKLYVNGVQETSFSTATYPSQNYDTNLNNSNTANIGRYVIESSRYYDGYLSEVILVDGQQLAPTSFGVANSDGVWTPIIYSGTYGTNGFNLQFEDAAALGTDSSPNGNTFTVNNLTSIDQSTDYPVVNYATLNPLAYRLDSGVSLPTYSDGNTTVSYASDGGAGKSSMGTICFDQGKWYWEYKVNSANDTVFGGITRADYDPNDNFAGRSIYYNKTGALSVGTGTGGTADGSYGNSYTTNDIIGVAFDCDNGVIWFSKNGTWQNSATQSEIEAGTTTNSATTGITLNQFWSPFLEGANSGMSINFGSPAFAISSGNTDGNSYGNFEYAVPSGYYSLNTKNLSEYG